MKSFSALYNADTITDSSFGPRNDKNGTFPNPGNTDSSVRHRKPTLGSVPFVSVLTRLTICEKTPHSSGEMKRLMEGGVYG